MSSFEKRYIVVFDMYNLNNRIRGVTRDSWLTLPLAWIC